MQPIRRLSIELNPSYYVHLPGISDPPVRKLILATALAGNHGDAGQCFFLYSAEIFTAGKGGGEGLRIYSSGQRNRHNREKERKMYSMRRFII